MTSERHASLADALLGDLERLRLQLFAPTVERKPMSVSDGANCGTHIEIVDVELAEPSFSAKRLIIASIAQGIDKVLALQSSGGQIDEDDWTAPVGTTSIRDAPKRGKRNVRATGS